MLPAGLFLLLSAAPAEPPSGPVVGPLALTKGDRIPFVGDLTDDADTAGRVTKRVFALRVALFVLDTAEGFTDVAVFTELTPETDPGVIAAAAHVMGTAPDGRPATPLSRLDLIRIDTRGRVVRLVPPDHGPPFLLGPKAATAAFPPVPLTEPPQGEVGMFVPLAESAARVGTTWTMADGTRPARSVTARGTELRNGGQCVVVETVQHSDGYDDLARVATGWRRTDTLIVSPADGLAREVKRKIEHREGKSTVQTIAVAYKVRPVEPHVGSAYHEVRAEIVQAAWLGAELDKLLAAGAKGDRGAVDRVRGKAKAFAEDRPATAFRPAVDAVRLRAEAALAGRALGDH